MSNTIHPIVKPEVVHLEDLFRLIEQGTLRIPDFQRPFVWNERDMRELFDSVKKGYPIGSLLIWEPQEDFNIRSAKKIGPFEISKNTAHPSFVIDGYQRLSTLFSVLKSDSIKAEEENWKYNIYLNFENNEEELVHTKGSSDNNPWMIPLHSLWNSKDYFKVLDRIRTSGIDSSGQLLQRLEELYSDFRGYKLALIRMVGGDIQDAINIFTRLNSTGRKVSEVQMLNALTNTNLESQFEAIKEELRELHFSKIEDRLLLRAHYLSTETDIYKMSPSSYVKLLAKNQPRDYSLETKIGLSRAAQFLRKECNVPGIDWLPYGLQFLLIGEFFRLNPTPSALQNDKLKTWFWQTSYLGWFGSASGAKVNVAISEIRELARNANHEIKIANTNSSAVDFPLVQKANSARVSTFYLFYFSLQPRTIQPKSTPTGKMTVELMASGPKEVLNPIFSSAKPKNKIANLVLSDIATPVTIIDAFKNDPSLAASHGVTSDALECLKNNDHDGFLQERQAELIRLESEFIKKWGLSPSDQNPKDSSEDSEIE